MPTTDEATRQDAPSVAIPASPSTIRQPIDAPGIGTPPLSHGKVVARALDAVVRSSTNVPSHTVRDAGDKVMTGGALTVSSADDDVTLPQELVTTQVYDPASDCATEAMVSEAEVAPGMLKPPLRH